MRRTIGVIVLGLLMALFCLAIGGLGCMDKDEADQTAGEFLSSETVKCKRVVGTGYSQTRVYYCHNYELDRCFYVAREGGLLEVPCSPHPFVEKEVN